MLRLLVQLLRFLHLPTFIRGRADEPRGWRTPTRNGQFASFMSVQGCSRRRHPDRHDRRVNMQKLTRVALTVLGAGGFAWVALESARALTVF